MAMALQTGGSEKGVFVGKGDGEENLEGKRTVAGRFCGEKG